MPVAGQPSKLNNTVHEKLNGYPEEKGIKSSGFDLIMLHLASAEALATRHSLALFLSFLIKRS